MFGSGTLMQDDASKYFGIHQNFFQMFHWMLTQNKIKYFFEWVGNNLDKTIKIVIKLWWCTSTYVRAVEIDTEFKLV